MLMLTSCDKILDLVFPWPCPLPYSLWLRFVLDRLNCMKLSVYECLTYNKKQFHMLQPIHIPQALKNSIEEELLLHAAKTEYIYIFLKLYEV